MNYKLLVIPFLVFAQPSKHSASTPTTREGKWMTRHLEFVERAKQGNIEVLLLGDSLVEQFKEFPVKAVNFGIAGDRTENVLWRTQNGELEGFLPKVVLLQVGTNNTLEDGRANSALEIVEGIQSILKEIQKRSPQTKILLMGLFPRGTSRKSEQMEKIEEVNKTLAKLDDGGKTLQFIDLGALLLPEGRMSRSLMPDFLHLSRKGYEVWARAIKGPLNQLLKGP